MNSLLAVALLRPPMCRYLSPGSDLVSPHRLSQLMTCSVQLADARCQASALLDEGRYNNAALDSRYLLHRLQLRDQSAVQDASPGSEVSAGLASL